MDELVGQPNDNVDELVGQQNDDLDIPDRMYVDMDCWPDEDEEPTDDDLNFLLDPIDVITESNIQLQH